MSTEPVAKRTRSASHSAARMLQQQRAEAAAFVAALPPFDQVYRGEYSVNNNLHIAGAVVTLVQTWTCSSDILANLTGLRIRDQLPRRSQLEM